MRNIAIILFSTLILMSCNGKSQTNDNAEQPPVTDVSVTTISYGHIDKEIELTAVTAFLKKNIITAPNASFITACYVQPGTVVRSGQTLYRLESKEREALGEDVVGTNMGIVDVKATTSGIVADVQQQTGSYVTEGSPLCSIANTSSMVFEVEVPTEDMEYAKAGTTCRIILPDGRTIAAVLSTPLATMNINTQVQQIPAHAKTAFLPEGLRAKALLKTTNTGKSNQILPKSAIQSDDNMTSFWVLKIIANGSVKKIPVTIGNSNNSETEIIAPSFSESDKIVTSGSYQLQDGDRVRIIK